MAVLEKSECIQIRGARQHNLKSVDIDIPKGKLTVITGPSGCGKSSLAFHTIFAEGQRRYLECLGTRAQSVLRTLDKPEYDYIDGLSPTIALEQTERRPPNGTTVGMLTEVHDYLRLLYAILGKPHDPDTGELLEKLTSPEIVEKLCQLPERSRVVLLAPIQVPAGSDVAFLKDDLRRQGFVRVVVNGEIYDLEDEWEISEDFSVVIDRLAIRDGVASRMADSLEIALRIHSAGAKALIQEPGEEGWQLVSYTTGFHNPKTGYLLPIMDAASFSYSTKYAQCPECRGTGRVEGVTCKSCLGGRLTRDYLNVFLPFEKSSSLGIDDLTNISVNEVLSLLSEIDAPEVLSNVVEDLVEKAQKRLQFLQELGIGYLKLSQWANELSAGEYQRLRIASQLGAGLSGVLYVLDEPSRGLHRDDVQSLVKALHTLRDSGNTVVMVEHDPQLIMESDWLIDMGPRAGELGGAVLASGEPSELMKQAKGATAPWIAQLKGEEEISRPEVKSAQWLEVSEATLNNLDSISARFPLSKLSVVTGRSGVGKSSLITKTLAPYAQFKLNRGTPFTPEATITGLDYFNRVVTVDQSPIGKSPRSSPATFTGIFDEIRKLYSNLPLSKQRGYKANRFSFNVKGGRCEKCLGMGRIQIELQFLNDAYVQCDACGGTRYNNETLEVRYKGRNIAEVLDASISDNLQHFALNPKISLALESLESVGLGYLRLGQGANTLSGGEAQRVKIATELMKVSVKEHTKSYSSKTLFLLDEPTLGLHFSDVEILLTALKSLLIGSNTIIAIEHSEQFCRQADYELELK